MPFLGKGNRQWSRQRMADSQDKTVDGFVTVTIPLLSMGMQDCVLVSTNPFVYQCCRGSRTTPSYQ